MISISSVEHMFSDDGRSGDVLAVLEARRVLRPGGRLVVTVPMSEGMPFHESRTGDDRYHLPYRLYTPAVLEERFHGLPGLDLVAQAYVPHRVPLPDAEANEFMQFWMDRSYEGRAEWDGWAPILVDVFHARVPRRRSRGRDASLQRPHGVRRVLSFEVRRRRACSRFQIPGRADETGAVTSK